MGDYLALDTKSAFALFSLMNFSQLLRRFQTEEDCKAYLVARRWPNGVICPRCQNTKVWEVKSRPFHWQCKGCNKNGYRFSVISGTIFENTKYPLRAWFKVAFLMYHSKKGMSSLQIHRMIGTGSYETALYMCNRIRVAMGNSAKGQLLGEVEVDETFVGGKAKNRHVGDRGGPGRGGLGSGKKPVVGAISRQGKVVARVVDSVDAKTLKGFVREVVSDKVSLLVTDEWAGYHGLGKEYPHQVIRHTHNQYVFGAIHTNTIEGFWSLFKRGIVGTFHKISETYLPLYVNECAFGTLIASC
jgi:transposase-like protein/IS1 family transposase